MKKLLIILFVLTGFIANSQINPISPTNRLRIRYGHIQYYDGSTWVVCGDSTVIAGKLSASDTASMLANYRTGMIANTATIPLKLNISDTAAMLTNYRLGLISGDAGKLNTTDTASMLNNYRTGMIANTAGILTKVNISDTASMLSNYRTGLIANNAGKLNTTDTASMLGNYRTDMIANTAGLLTKVNISDTASMLSNYRTGIISLTTKAPLASPTFTGTVTIPTPFTLGATSVTSTGTQLNYLNAATGTTGTTSTNLVYSTSPTLVMPVLGVATATSINKLTFTQPATGATLTLVDNSSLITAGAFATTITSTATTNATLPAGTGTLAYLAGTNTWSGATTFSNTLTASGIFSTAGTIANANFLLASTTGGAHGTTQSQTEYQFGGSTNVQFRVGMRGGSSNALTAGVSAANMLVGTQVITEGPSGVHPILANVVFNTPTITNGTATTTDATNLYIAGAPTGTATITNPVTSLWVAAGNVRLGGNIGFVSTSPTARLHLPAGTATASTAPLKFTSGTNLTTAEAGGEEFNNSFYQTKASGLRYGVGGVIADFTADVNAGTTSETDLFTYTTPASTLAATGEKLIGRFIVNLTDVVTSYQFRAYFGGTAVTLLAVNIQSGLGACAAQIEVTVIRTGASTARISINETMDQTFVSGGVMEADITGLTFTNTNIIKVTVQGSGGSASSGDAVAKLGTIFWYPAAAN